MSDPLCLNTLMWAGRPLAGALAEARETGIDALDLGAAFERGHLDPTHGSSAVEELRPVLRGWRTVAITADHPDLARARDEGGREAVVYTGAALRCAEALGARVVSTSLGTTDVDAWETAFDRAIASLREVLNQTAGTGVRLAVTLHLDDVLNSTRKVERLLAAIPDRRLGLTVDTGYLQVLRIPLRELLRIARDRVYHVHLRDAAKADPYRLIGRGEFSFRAGLRALREHGYDGALSIALADAPARHGVPVPDALAEAVPRLREWLAESEGAAQP